MPTTIHFVGAEQSITVEEDYERVAVALLGPDAWQQFTRGTTRVSVFKASIAYVEEEESVEEAESVKEEESVQPGRLGRVVASDA